MYSGKIAVPPGGGGIVFCSINYSLWFCLAINPLTNLLNSTGYGFNIRHNNTTLSKLNHLLYMDDIKLYASKKNHI
jgi:hypothetical protein